MTIDNIALVRAMDIDCIPFDGVLRTISETSYIKKNMTSDLASAWKRSLEQSGQVAPFDWNRFGDESYMNERIQTLNELASSYVPYTSYYNSMVLCSLNGLVPDDIEKGFANNTFSNKPCAVIDGLLEHIDQVVSLVPTDTALKDSVKLSKDAIILISEEAYQSLSEEEKEQLSNLDLQVQTFEGSLKEAVTTTLEQSSRYTPETLTLSKNQGWILPSETSEETKETIDQIAKEKSIAQALHMDILKHQTDDMDKLQSVKDEYENLVIVDNYYNTEFYIYLFERMDIDETTKYSLLNQIDATEELVNQILRNGIEEYKSIVNFFNQGIERLKQEGKLPTPEQIVTSVKQNEPISLTAMLEKQYAEDYKVTRSIYADEEHRKIQMTQSLKKEQIQTLADQKEVGISSKM